MAVIVAAAEAGSDDCVALVGTWFDGVFKALEEDAAAAADADAAAADVVSLG